MPCRAGFTLIEVILVLVILVLIATLGIPLLRGTLAQQELKYAADQLRGEWMDTRVHAMEEGQIFCMRGKIGGSTLIIDRVLDTHFTAGLSSRQTTSRFDASNEYDPYEKGEFTGEMQDFILRDPNRITAGTSTTVIELPGSVMIADVIAVAEERSAFYLGLAVPEGQEADEIYGIEAIMTGELRLGETAGSEGTAWSTPIFFYPDGSTSTAAVLLKNGAGRCIEIRLRGLTGTGTVTGIALTTNYIGKLEVNRF
jgi:prepilin-type N-terminal cleavage/methylation domain-containing protein